jgi:hypothetical protein
MVIAPQQNPPRVTQYAIIQIRTLSQSRIFDKTTGKLFYHEIWIDVKVNQDILQQPTKQTHEINPVFEACGTDSVV